jgi:hypothetical protein
LVLKAPSLPRGSDSPKNELHNLEGVVQVTYE